jgi:hypothetical protein
MAVPKKKLGPFGRDYFAAGKKPPGRSYWEAGKKPPGRSYWKPQKVAKA